MSDETLPTPFIPASSGGGVTGSIDASGTITATPTETSMSVDGKQQIIIENNGSIQIGNPTEPNSVFINGGVQFLVKELTSTAATYNIITSDYFIKVTNSSYTNINLPEASGLNGQKFVVLRNYSGAGILSINPNGSDKIEDDTDPIKLSRFGDRSQFLCDGVDTWYTV